MSQINWNIKQEDIPLVKAIAERGVSDLEDIDDLTEIMMDITACHLNGTPLDLKELLEADIFNFAHDYVGIRNHIDRKTGTLDKTFLPRYILRNPKNEEVKTNK